MPHKKILTLSTFSILAVLFFLLENYLPKPMPFFRIGLANVFILIVLWQLDIGLCFGSNIIESYYWHTFLRLNFHTCSCFFFRWKFDKFICYVFYYQN